MWQPTKIDWSSDKPLFRLILQALADDIASGVLPPGEQLPASRELADYLGVARGTVRRAYSEAQRLELIRRDVGRGSYVRAREALDAKNKSLLEPTSSSELGVAVPLHGVDPDIGQPLAQLAERVDRAALLRHRNPSGIVRHRRSGQRWLARCGVSVSEDEVLLCMGAQHALFVTLTVLRRRIDVIYVDELTYPGVIGAAEALLFDVVPVASGDRGMQLPRLERAIARRGPGAIFTMPTIHNPLGTVLSAEERQGLAAIAERGDCYIIEDDANRLLAARPPPPVRELLPERTFYLATVSKIVGPGLRAAFLTGPPSLHASLLRAIWATAWMVSPLGFEIVTLWQEDGSVAHAIRRKRSEARRRQKTVRQIFGERVYAHPSSMHAWIHLDGETGADTFTAVAAERNIVVTPASAFWVPKKAPPKAIRVALAGVSSTAALRRALRSLAQVDADQKSLS